MTGTLNVILCIFSQSSQATLPLTSDYWTEGKIAATTPSSTSKIRAQSFVDGTCDKCVNSVCVCFLCNDCNLPPSHVTSFRCGGVFSGDGRVLEI